MPTPRNVLGLAAVFAASVTPGNEQFNAGGVITAWPRWEIRKKWCPVRAWVPMASGGVPTCSQV